MRGIPGGKISPFARDIDRAIAIAHVLADYLGDARELNIDRAIAIALDLARAVGTAHDRARDPALKGALFRVLRVALVAGDAIAAARGLDPAWANDPALNRDFDLALARTLEVAGALTSIDGRREGGGASRVAPMAGRLLGAAARLLPARERARYAEELQSELWQIARVGGGRRRQLAYAARQVMAAPRLRAGLRVPRRRGAMP